MRVLVDTNIYLDYFFDREGSEEAATFFSNCHKRRNRTYVTSISLRDIEYLAHKKFHSKQISTMIQSRVYSLCSRVIGISADDAIGAMYSDYNDYEDGLIVEAAKSNMLDAIVTNNKKDFVNHGMPIFTPKELNDIWAKDPMVFE